MLLACAKGRPRASGRVVIGERGQSKVKVFDQIMFGLEADGQHDHDGTRRHNQTNPLYYERPPPFATPSHSSPHIAPWARICIARPSLTLRCSCKQATSNLLRWHP
jgi:hypothetical protein